MSKKMEFSNNVLDAIHDLCKLVFNAKTDEDMKTIFGLNEKQMKTVVKKIVEVIPDHLFKQANGKTLEELKNIFAKEFIFFQMQEKVSPEVYKEDLSDFINIFSRDIEKKFRALQPEEKT